MAWKLGLLDRNEQRTVSGDEGELIAVVCHECLTSRIPEMEANARLIAAAPDLLKALEDLDRETSGGCQLCAVQFIIAAREAVAKAKGIPS